MLEGLEEKFMGRIKQLGFEIEETRNEGFYIKKDTIPTVQEIVSVIKEIPRDKSIFFWNYYHRTISDPGSYVTAKIKEDHAIYMEGNHGWSSDFKEISLYELAELIQKNWDKDCDLNGRFVNSIEITNR